MHILKTSYQGNPNVGLFGWANDKVCLIGTGFKSKVVNDIKKVLDVPVYEISLCNTDLIGVFCIGNNEAIVVPDTILDFEIEELKKICKKVGLDLEIVTTNLNALGNNILCNDLGALVNPDYSARVKKQLRQVLRVNLKPGTIALHGIPGSLCVIKGENAVVSNNILEKEEDKLKELFGVSNITHGTVNFGSQNIRSGVLCNKNGFIVGDMSSGVEMTDIDEGLGFLNQ
ncbi:translation initiation factor IF-6 [Candidatus Woesearchaeota archaeon]|jgi:translation initiation factor 6|nr:translation initiation factor IF-6 [Candidatus Woesearchaeota archaeon]